MKLKILVGTMTQTALRVAQAAAMACSDLVQPVEVLAMDGLETGVFDDADALYLVCTSTYGSGDLPDNAQGLFLSLDTQPKYLGHVRYGLMALGDATYGSTYAHGGRLFDERLQGLGARRIGEPWVHDASAGTVPEELGADWARHWLQDALAGAGKAVA